MHNLLMVVVMLVAIPVALSAEPVLPSTVQFPGSLSISAASGEPTEPGNIASSGTLSQGINMLRKNSMFVVGFFDLSVRTDVDGYEWNNTMPYRTGVKFVHVDSHGVFEATVGVMAEGRKVSTRRAHRTASLSYWRGWRGDALAGSKGGVRPKAFPGHTYATSGYLASREPSNWITNVTLEQGATLFSRSAISGGAFARASAAVDTDNEPWNNRQRMDVGVKLTRRLLTGVIEGGVSRRHTFERGARRSPSTVLFVNVWMGWTPRAIF